LETSSNELCEGRIRLGVEIRFFSQRAMGMEQPPQGSGHGTKQPELKDSLDGAPRYRF